MLCFFLSLVFVNKASVLSDDSLSNALPFDVEDNVFTPEM